MKTRLLNIFFFWMTMVLSFTSLHAQTEDHDPGRLFVIHKDSGFTAIDEGLEWTITFSCEDTLGTEYNHPVQMHFEGGGLNEFSSFALQEIDSVLMYQPEAVLAEGVYEITREHFPYIIGVDSTYTVIYFSKSIVGVFDIPTVGTKVVCQYEEQPLPLGFLGTALSVEDLGDRYAIYFNTQWKDLTDYYDYAILVKTLRPMEEAMKVESGQQMSKSRKKRTPITSTKFDSYSWPLSIPVELKNKMFDDLNISGIEITGGMDFEGCLGVDLVWTALIDGTRKEVESLGDFVSGCELSISAKVGVKGSTAFNFTVNAAASLPILGLTRQTSIGSMKCEADLGLYLDISGAVEFDLANLQFEGCFGFQDDQQMSPDAKNDWVTMGACSTTLSGKAALKFGVEVKYGNETKYKSAKRSTESVPTIPKTTDDEEKSGWKFGIAVDLISIEGKVKFEPGMEQEHNPQALYSTWEKEKENFWLELKLLEAYVDFSYNRDFEIIDSWVKRFKIPAHWSIFTVLDHKTTYLPERKSWTSLWYDLINDFDTQYYYYHMTYAPWEIFTWESAVWIYDLQEKRFTVKNKIMSGSTGINELSGKSDAFSLRKGNVYQMVEVFSRPGENNPHMTDIIPEPMRIPYSMYPTTCEVKNNTVALTTYFDKQAIADCHNHLHTFEAGFQWLKVDEESSLTPEEQINKHPEKAFYPPVDLVNDLSNEKNDVYYRIPDLEGGKYICRTYLSVEDELGKHVFYGESSTFRMDATPALSITRVLFNTLDTQATVEFKTSEAFKQKCDQSGYRNVTITLTNATDYDTKTQTVTYDPVSRNILSTTISINPESKHALRLVAQFSDEAMPYSSPYYTFETWKVLNENGISIDASENEATIKIGFVNKPERSYDYRLEYTTADKNFDKDVSFKLCTINSSSISCTLKDLDSDTNYKFRISCYNGSNKVFQTSWERTFATRKPSHPDDEWIDLGLSVKWRSWNLGSTDYMDKGFYYSWGETDLWDGVYLGDSPCTDITSSEYDPARKMGFGRMPTASEVQELIDNCEWSWNNSSKCIVATKDDNYLYFPVCGYYSDDGTLVDASKGVYLWTSTFAQKVSDGLDVDEVRAYIFMSYKSSPTPNIDETIVSFGLPIRPVKDK